LIALYLLANPFTSSPYNLAFKQGLCFICFTYFVLFFKLLFKASDAYYAVDADTLPAFTLLSQLKGAPMVYDAHEYFSEVPELSGKQFKKAIWHKVVSIGSRQAKLNLTVGPALGKSLKRTIQSTLCQHSKSALCANHKPY